MNPLKKSIPWVLRAVVGVLLIVSPVIAGSVDSNTAAQVGSARELLQRGEYEKGIEQLREAYQLFPFNPTFKRSLAEGYAAFGNHQFKQKRFEQADESFNKVLELYPEDSGTILMRGICNYHLKKYDVARYELERAKAIKPDSVEVLYFLGLVEIDTDHIPHALELLEQALKRAPGRKEIAELLVKTRKENTVESGMDRGHSSRFDLTYDPGVDSAFARSILSVLESAANVIGAELGLFPEARIPVRIYKRADYKTVTDSPGWSGGFYDGKIRLPFGAMNEVTPGIRGILFHEYAHVVVFELTRGNCPLWLNEGIAEMFGRTQYNRALPKIDKSKLVGFKKLETSFKDFSTANATLAYQQSYSLVNYLVETYGWHRVKQILTGLGGGLSFDESIVAALKDYDLNYETLVKEWRTSLEKESSEK